MSAGPGMAPSALATPVHQTASRSPAAQAAQAPRHGRPGLLWAAAFLGLLGACASPPAAPPGAPAPLSGRLLLKVDASPQAMAQSVSAGFELTGSDAAGELRLATPLGTQLVEARWAPGAASLRTSDGLREFPDLNSLAREALGEEVPLAALPHWLAGRPWPAQAFELATDGSGFSQLGWSIDTRRLAAEGQLEARRPEAPTILLRVRLDR